MTSRIMKWMIELVAWWLAVCASGGCETRSYRAFRDGLPGRGDEPLPRWRRHFHEAQVKPQPSATVSSHRQIAGVRESFWSRSFGRMFMFLAFAAFASTCSVVSLSWKDQGNVAHAAGSESGAVRSPIADYQGGGIADAARELDERVVTLPPGSPLDFENTVFGPLDPALARARVVGLGEATHGTADFLELKHRLFRHLVEVHGHRALGYELNYAASLALDHFVATGEGSLTELLGDLLFIQANEEVRALLEWMREHNRDCSEDERLRFIGIDSQLDMWNLELHREIFRERFTLVYTDLRTHFDLLADLGRIDYRSITPDEVDRIRSVLIGMADIVQDSVRGMERRDAMIAAHLIEALQRSHEFLTSAYRGDNNVRDGQLAANALWIADFLGDDVPYSVWAHNSHVGSDSDYYGENGPESMGYHLTRRLGRGYFRVGTAFTRGAFVALRGDWRGRDTTAPLVCRLDEDPPTGSVNAVLDRAKNERFLIRVQDIIEETSLHRHLDAERPLLGVGDFFAGEAEPHYQSPERIIRVLETFDAIFYFSNTRGIQPLNSIDAP